METDRERHRDRQTSRETDRETETDVRERELLVKFCGLFMT